MKYRKMGFWDMLKCFTISLFEQLFLQVAIWVEDEGATIFKLFVFQEIIGCENQINDLHKREIQVFPTHS